MPVGASRLGSAAENSRDHVSLEALVRERRNRKRRERAAAHGVDVAQRVGCGDLAVDERVVDDRREEIDRLHDRRAVIPPVHTGIVRIPEVHQNPWVSLRRDVAQHLSELASGEFARSTGAAHHLSEPLLFREHVVCGYFCVMYS